MQIKTKYNLATLNVSVPRLYYVNDFGKVAGMLPTDLKVHLFDGYIEIWYRETKAKGWVPEGRLFPSKLELIHSLQNEAS